MRITAYLTVAILTLLVHGCAISQTYSAKPITATVVDAETGEPLEGVHVVAYWRLHDPVSWRRAADLELIETVTNKDGKFHFPGWTGKTPPRIGMQAARLDNVDPGMDLFKSGYTPRGLDNDLQPERLRDENHTWERYSDWDGKVIKLSKFSGDPETYASLVRGTLTDFGSGIPCPWKKYPRYMAALIKEKERLDSLHVRNYLPSLQTMERYFTNEGCGSAREFFKDYLK